MIVFVAFLQLLQKCLGYHSLNFFWLGLSNSLLFKVKVWTRSAEFHHKSCTMQRNWHLEKQAELNGIWQAAEKREWTRCKQWAATTYHFTGQHNTLKLSKAVKLIACRTALKVLNILSLWDNLLRAIFWTTNTKQERWGSLWLCHSSF